MKRTTFGKAVLSSLLVATTMVGCTGAAFRPSASVVQQKGDPGKLATAAEKALTDRNAIKAVAAAEAAVTLEPQNAAYRQILGRAYVLAGRFASAQTALSDAVTLGNSDASTIVNLALVQVAQGRADAARSLLVANAGIVPASDYGLAMALAGDPGEGVRILSEAIHDPSATARTRQNLAYAYALAGRWKDARVLVGLDMAPLAANKRISDWAQIAEASLAPMRVAALMGVTLNGADAGQPVALALAPVAPAAPVEMAQVAPDVVPPVEMAQAEVQPAAPMQMVQALPQTRQAQQASAKVAPVIRAASKPMRVAAHDFIVEDRQSKAAAARAQSNTATPAARMQSAAFIKPVGNGASNWVVQLGAYDNAEIAKEKWLNMAGRNSTLSTFTVMTSEARVKGKAYHRLAISGFGSRADAVTACRSIRQCFVREGAQGATPQRWAVANKGRQYASR